MTRAFLPADVMLPKQTVDFQKWAVIACDQFTSDRGFWAEVEQEVSGVPSTYRLILPEVYLEDADVKDRLAEIRNTMDTYVKDGLFDTYENALIYIERTDSVGNIRAGVVGCVDLEQYDFAVGSTSLIRATEATVVERIPPRVRIRENASIELPHIMLLVDDAKKRLIEKLSGETQSMRKVYDFTLMQGSGHLKGWLLSKEQTEVFLQTIDDIAAEQTDASGNLLLFAMGDGNHSLATAKTYYEQLKKEHPNEDLSKHPARYALCELVNLHSDALQFEAIHRIVTEVDTPHLLAHMTEELGMCHEGDGQKLYMVIDGKKQPITFSKTTSNLTVGTLQNFLDDYLKKYGGKIDYIHGEDALIALTGQARSIGFLLPEIEKEALFPSVQADGVLPRKTFSMGHAKDKRYYMECRMIRA